MQCSKENENPTRGMVGNNNDDDDDDDDNNDNSKDRINEYQGLGGRISQRGGGPAHPQ